MQRLEPTLQQTNLEAQLQGPFVQIRIVGVIAILVHHDVVTRTIPEIVDGFLQIAGTPI
jgi:hypothetical protein